MKDCLHIWKNGAKDEKPHFYEARDETVVRSTAKSVIEREEACLEEFAQVFGDNYGGSLVDTALDMH